MTDLKQLYHIQFQPRNIKEFAKTINGNAVQIIHMGLFIGHDNNWANNKEYKRVETLIPSMFDASSLQDAKIYRFPKLTLPREKVKVICDKYKAKVVRDIDNSDIAIVSQKYLSGMCDHLWHQPKFNSKDEAFIWYKEVVGTGIFEKEVIEKLDLFFHQLPEDAVTIWGSDYYYGNLTPSVDDFVKSLEKTDNYNSRGYTHYIKQSVVPHYLNILKHESILVWDTEINKLATSDSVVLTEEHYTNIIKMVQSSDKDNAAVGLEIMANCNIEESHTFLSLLFYFHTNSLKDCKSWNHVNFKALKTKFNKYINSYGFHYVGAFDQIIKYLIEDKALTQFAVNVIANSLFKNIFQNNYGVKANSVFEIDPSSLILKPEFSNRIQMKDIQEAKRMVENPLPF